MYNLYCKLVAEKKDLQSIAWNINQVCEQNNIHLVIGPEWIPRD